MEIPRALRNVLASACTIALTSCASRAPALHAVSPAGMVIARDPETGHLGMPTAEQMREIEGRRPETMRATPEGFTEIRRPDGAVGLLLNGRLQSYSVARLGAGGRVVTRCVTASSDTAAVLTLQGPEER